MNMRKWFGLMLVLMLAFVLAACGGDGDDDNGNNGGDSNSASSVDLPQTITAEDPNFGGSVTVNYPADWVAVDIGGGVSLANSQETLDLVQGATDAMPAIDENNIFMTVSPISPDIVSFLMGDGVEATPATLLENTLLGGEGLDTQPVEITDINGKSGATVVGVSTNPDEPGRLFAAAVQVGDGYVIVTAITNPDETDYDATVRAIAGAVDATFASIDVPVDATEEAAG